MTKIYRYHIVDACGRRLESNIPEKEQAETYIQFLIEREGHDPKKLSIEAEHVPQLHGHRLGRDPDLH